MILRVTDFADDHPEFRPSVVLEAGSAARTRVSVVDKPREQSGLRFAHREHLVEHLNTPQGDVTLGCADCHQAEPYGTVMKSIVFEDTCQRCHSLAFDTRRPDRQALHGDPARLSEDLFEFYGSQALRGDALEADAPEVARRRPGRDLTEVERATVLQWVGEKTSRVRSFLLDENGVCAGCHVLEVDDGQIRIQPVNLVPLAVPPGSPQAGNAQRWMPLAQFRHDKHASAECESCHAARQSESATDVLLPGIERCRECHGGEEPQAGRLVSPCTSCHDFHRERFGLMRASQSHPRGGA